MKLLRLLASALTLAGSAPAVRAFDVPATRVFLDALAASTEGGAVAPRWLPDGNSFWFTEGRPDAVTAVWRVDPAAGGARTPLLDVARARAALQAALGAPAPGVFGVSDFDAAVGALTLEHAGRTWRLDLAGYGLAPEPARPAAERAWGEIGVARDQFPIAYRIREQRAPDGAWIATLPRHDVALRDPRTGALRAVTTDGTAEQPWFFAGDIMEPSGPAWSPDGTKLALRRHDMRAVPGMPIVDWLALHPGVTSFRYWAKAGQPLPITTFFVHDLATGTSTAMDHGGGPDHYAAFLDWSPDGREVWFYRASRDFRRMELVAADAATGRARVVLEEERTDGFVEFPWNAVKNLRFVGDGAEFLWHSDRDGWPHWRRYTRAGAPLGQVTRGAWSAGSIEHVDVRQGLVYLHGASDPARPYDVHFLRVPLDGSSPAQPLTRAPGRHRAALAPSGAFFVTTHAHLDRPPRTDLHRSDGELLATLASATVDAAFRGDWPAPEEFVVKAADGVTDVHGIILKPWGFDPARRYPVIERIYGAMQSTAVPRGWFGAGAGSPGSEYTTMLAWFARLGFAVVVMDTPGTPGRGREYQMRTSGRWPDGVVADHVAGLRRLAASRPWLDLERLGLDGNSYGGYVAVRAAIEAPGFYRAIAASVPEAEFRDHLAWIEFQLGSPADNPEAYDRGSNLDKVGRIRDPLLIVAGTSDGNVGFSANMKLLDALAEAGRPYEYVLFPGTNHSHQGRGDRYAYAVTAIGEFFRRRLQP